MPSPKSLDASALIRALDRAWFGCFDFGDRLNINVYENFLPEALAILSRARPELLIGMTVQSDSVLSGMVRIQIPTPALSARIRDQHVVPRVVHPSSNRFARDWVV